MGAETRNLSLRLSLCPYWHGWDPTAGEPQSPLIAEDCGLHRRYLRWRRVRIARPDRDSLNSMNERPHKEQFRFPRWTNTIRPHLGLGLTVAPLYLIALIYYAFNPTTTMSGYQPPQPVEYSHTLHAGELGIDCRYCHFTVENAATAAIPPTEVCMNCHASILTESTKLLPVRESHNSGMPIKWVRVHDLPDFVYFNHSAHVTRGIGCESCHGRIDHMDQVAQEQRLSMRWCLDCHREPENHLRPVDVVTTMGYAPAEDQIALGSRLRLENQINPSLDCSTCHR